VQQAPRNTDDGAPVPGRDEGTHEIRCPRCGRRIVYREISDLASFPFCSRRCRLIDLDMWLTEEHRISEPLDDGTPEPADLSHESSRPPDGDHGRDG